MTSSTPTLYQLLGSEYGFRGAVDVFYTAEALSPLRSAIVTD